MNGPQATDALGEAIASLDDLPRPELVKRWQALYRADPPKGISRTLLMRAVAWQLQAKRHGGLRPATRRRLWAIVNGSPDAAPRSARRRMLKPGSRLVREWNGSIHMVEVADGSFVWNGTRYRSLSAVARAITGARWSGPRFFGLPPGCAT